MSRVRAFAGLGALAVLLLAGCAPTGVGTDSATPSASLNDGSKAGAMVIDQDFPDPDVLAVDGTYYAYATNTSTRNIQYATSKNLKTWTVANGDALPDLPTWAQRGNTWAPDVSQPTPGHFVMYFVAREPISGKQCIGMAKATSPSGPFVSSETKPMICQLAQGGSIDPSTFTDTDGTRYLVWKNDGNCCSLPTWLQLARLSADGASLAGPITRLIKQTEGWEGNLIEAPTLVKHGSTYVLFYSANDYGGDKYAIGYATASSVAGPYTKHPGPFLSTSLSKGRYRGPGGQDVVQVGSKWYFVFHSWDPAYIYRGMSILPLTWKNDAPVIRIPRS